MASVKSIRYLARAIVRVADFESIQVEHEEVVALDANDNPVREGERLKRRVNASVEKEVLQIRADVARAARKSSVRR